MEETFDLLADSLALLGRVAKDTDEEKYVLEVCLTAVRRVLASWVLLESGLPQGAHMILRNAMELMLIAIDICYSRVSLDEWKMTKTENVNQLEGARDWYFTATKMHNRIGSSGAAYPPLEVRLGEDVYQEWGRISNMSLHTHSQAQVRQLFDATGRFQVLALKPMDAYEKDLRLYQEIVFDILTILVGVPRYHKLIGENTALLPTANSERRCRQIYTPE